MRVNNKFKKPIVVFLGALYMCGFCIGMTIPTQALRKDFAFKGFANSIGSPSGIEASMVVAVDGSGNVYTAGMFDGSVDFNQGGTADIHTPVGDFDIFLTKINANGTYGYTRTFGSTGSDTPGGIAFDSSNNVYLVGVVDDGSVDFDPDGSGDVQPTAGFDGFITKINANGTYGFSYVFGGSGGDSLQSIAIDSSNNVVIGGSFSGTVDFDPTGGTDNHVSGGSTDAFVTKLTSAGAYVYTLTFGSTSNDGLHAVAVDSSDNIIYGGYFQDTVDFDPTGGTDNRVAVGNDSFLGKISGAASPVYAFTKTFGNGSGGAELFNIAIDSSNNIVTAGNFYDSVDFDTDNSGGDLTSVGVVANFVVKYSSTGNYVFTTQTPFGHVDDKRGLVITNDDAVILASYFTGTRDFDPGSGDDSYTAQGSNSDIFATRFNSDGSYGSTMVIGGSGTDTVLNAVYNAGNNQIYIAGYHSGMDFDPSPTSEEVHTAGGLDAFVAAYGIENFYTISGLPTGMTLVEQSTGASVEPGSKTGVIAGGSATLQLKYNGVPLALLTANFSNDFSWSGISGAIDVSAKKSVVAGLSSAGGVVGTHSLYIPKGAADSQVIICPNAVSLSDVNESCSNKQVLTEIDSNVQVVSIGGQQYWLVSGLSGTGGLSIAALAATGTSPLLYILVGMAVIATSFAVYAMSSRKSA